MTIITRLVLVALAAVTAIGCGALYTDVRVPRAYRSAAPSDVTATPSDESVVGEACYQSLLYLVAWGDASYAAAARNEPECTTRNSSASRGAGATARSSGS